jgi:ribosomal protein S6--L-glutamate ligase
MKIAILSRNAKLYSTKRLYDAALKRGHQVRVIDALKCYMNITPDRSEVHYGKGEILDIYDAIIPRIGASITFYATAVLRQFESIGTYSMNPSLAITRARDKLRAHQVLARKRIGMPITSFAHSPSNTKDLIKMVGGAPLVIKLLEGTQGQGVLLAENAKMAETLIEAFRGLNAFFLVQEFIKEAGGTDIRCFVIGDKVVAAMQRSAQGGDFRSNLHRGATAQSIKITPQERKIAVQASNALGLNIAGVDIVRSARGPLVLEVNSSPGLRGIEAASGMDIADLIVRYVENNAKQIAVGKLHA